MSRLLTKKQRNEIIEQEGFDSKQNEDYTVAERALCLDQDKKSYEQALKDVGEDLLKLETLEQFHAARIQLMQGRRL